jgi:hypothetical protein
MILAGHGSSMLLLVRRNLLSHNTLGIWLISSIASMKPG